MDVDGKRLAVGLPTELLDGWMRGGNGAAAGGSGHDAGTAGRADGGPAEDDPADADPAELRADMAGTVVKWLVEPGTEVAAGDAVVVLEAMKMETQVSAHRDGTLTDVRAGAGGTVSAGAVLALIG